MVGVFFVVVVNVLFLFGNIPSVYISKYVYVCWYLAQKAILDFS